MRARHASPLLWVRDMRFGWSVLDISRQLEAGRTSSEELVRDCLGRLDDATGEGPRTLIRRNHRVIEQAKWADQARIRAKRQGRLPITPLHGIPVTVKDLFDIEGQITTAGSMVLRDAPPATRDSEVVARLKSAGALIIGTSNMTEFAFSGLGINPHYGTPLNPHDREQGRIPGGSSSGAAVSVTDAIAAVAIGTDTRGSCRIPAALCGVVGFKPTARLDSVGPLGRSVACCALADAIIADESGEALPSMRDLSGLRIGRLRNLVEEGLEASVAEAYESALARLERAGARFYDTRLKALRQLPEFLADGGIAGAEAYAWHSEFLATRRSEYDPKIASRLLAGKDQTPEDYSAKLDMRRRMIEQANFETEALDILACPTVPVTAPRIDSLAQEDDYVRTNMLMLRNPGIVSFLDRCAISLPIPDCGSLPVGLMLIGETMADRPLFSIASAVEAALAG